MNTCLNCGEKLLGKYCYNCGQKAQTRRFSFRTLFSEVHESLFEFNTDFFRTFKSLVSRPGIFIREYLSGKRKSFQSPFKYLFTMLTMNIAVTWVIKKPAIEPVKIYTSVKDPVTDQIVNMLINLVLLLIMIPFAAGMKIVQRKYTFLEYYVYLLYIHSQSILFIIILQLILFAFNAVLPGVFEGITWMFLFTVFYIWGFLTFFDLSQKSVIRLFASYLSSILIFAFLIFVGRLFI